MIFMARYLLTPNQQVDGLFYFESQLNPDCQLTAADLPVSRHVG